MKANSWIPLLLAILLAGCNLSDSTVAVNQSGEPDCVNDADCQDGSCQEGICIPHQAWEFLESCVQDSDCLSNLCVDTDDGGVCSTECASDAECDPDDQWRCLPHPDRDAHFCLPAPEDVEEPEDPRPTGASLLCGAAGVSHGGGLRLEHCLAPYDGGGVHLQGGGVHLHSGAFQVVAE